MPPEVVVVVEAPVVVVEAEVVVVAALTFTAA
jgi:hypothetical protein